MATIKSTRVKPDHQTEHMIIYSVVFLASVLAIEGGILTWHGDKDVALVMQSTVGTAVGGLLGFLVKSALSKDATDADPLPTKIITTPETPVNVVDQSDKPE